MPIHFLFSVTTCHFRITYNSVHMHQELILATTVRKEASDLNLNQPLRILAVTAASRSPSRQNVPKITEFLIHYFPVLQFIRLLAIIDKTLCLGTVFCYSRSGVSLLLFVVGMCERPRGRARTFILSCLVMFLDFVGAKGSGIVSTAPSRVAKQHNSPSPLQFYAGCPSCCNPPNLFGPGTGAGFHWFWPGKFVGSPWLICEPSEPSSETRTIHIQLRASLSLLLELFRPFTIIHSITWF